MINNVKQVSQLTTWMLGLDVVRAIAPSYETAMRAVIKHTGINNNWFTLHLVRGAEPIPFTLTHYHRLYPYASKDYLQSKLDQLTSENFLAKDPLCNYHLTKTGRKAIERTYQMAHREMGKVCALGFQKMQAIADMLQRVIITTLQTPYPFETHALKISRWTDVGEYAPTTTRIDQYLTDLKHFREDAHIASWQHHKISGEVWEALTLIWANEAHTAQKLNEKLAHRGHTQQTYTRALHTLVQRGWVEECEQFGHYCLTDLGRIIREESECLTDEYFFASWGCLSPNEQQELHLLLLELYHSLQQAAA